MSLFLDHAFTLSIADLTFQVTCRDNTIFYGSEDPYRHFISLRHNNELEDPITVELLLKKMPDVSGCKKIFDTIESWSLFEDDARKYIYFRGPANDNDPLWLADIDMSKRHVDIFCGTRFTKKQQSGQIAILNPLFYPLDQILLMQFLDGSGFTIHAAGAIYQGDGYIFAGPSRAGKSTISMLLSDYEDFKLLSDDRIVIRKVDGKFSMYGTPWPGEAGIAVNSKVPLRKIFFLEKSAKNMLRELTPKEALEKIMPVVSLPWYDKNLLANYLDTCGEVLEQTKSYVLSFTPDPGSVHELISMIKG